MKRVKFRIPTDLEEFSEYRWLISAVEWAYGDTSFLLGDDIVKLVEVKFKEEVEPKEIVENLKKIPYIHDVKLIPKNDHFLLYTRASISHAPDYEKSLRLIELQKKGLVVFEKGSMNFDDAFIYVFCENKLVEEVVATMKETYQAEVLSIEEYVPERSPLSKLTKRQAEVLIFAYKSGYFDEPRKITLRELAKMLGLSPSTVKEHLRKGLRRILDETLI
jgi:predicted DNA binding protein